MKAANCFYHSAFHLNIPLWPLTYSSALAHAIISLSFFLSGWSTVSVSAVAPAHFIPSIVWSMKLPLPNDSFCLSSFPWASWTVFLNFRSKMARRTSSLFFYKIGKFGNRISKKVPRTQSRFPVIQEYHCHWFIAFDTLSMFVPLFFNTTSRPSLQKVVS